MYLEFPTPDDYFAYLESRACPETHVDLSVTTGEISAQYNLQSVNYWAILSQRIVEPSGVSTIACCGILLLQTNSSELAADRHREESDQTATKVRQRLEDCRKDVQGRRFQVHPGKWTNSAPSYMTV